MLNDFNQSKNTKYQKSAKKRRIMLHRDHIRSVQLIISDGCSVRQLLRKLCVRTTCWSHTSTRNTL